jgi:hypothetical protein
VTACLVVFLVVPAGAAAQSPAAPESALVVDLAADGSGRLTAETRFDLTNADDRDAFEALRENATAQNRLREAFAARMRAVASTASAETGRDIRVRDPAVAVRTEESVGVVALSVTWTNLAAERDDSLVLAEPFAGEFAADASVTVRGPAGYRLADATPSPATRSDNAATWASDDSTDGFGATFAPRADDDTSADAPGFGVVVAVLALAVSISLVAGRRHR